MENLNEILPLLQDIRTNSLYMTWFICISAGISILAALYRLTDWLANQWLERNLSKEEKKTLKDLSEGKLPKFEQKGPPPAWSYMLSEEDIDNGLDCLVVIPDIDTSEVKIKDLEVNIQSLLNINLVICADDLNAAFIIKIGKQDINSVRDLLEKRNITYTIPTSSK